ncbi:MAG TPA: endonuclease III [Schlesneria sp.]|jgi:endonuclease-3
MAKSKSSDDRKQRARKIVRELAKTYPNAVCALHHTTPFQLLAATILSAQCTDERVNMVTPDLFRRWPDAAALAAAPVIEVEEVVRSTGFYRAKAANLVGMAKGLVEHHGGELPRTLEELIALPGVGRKTANVLLGTAFGIASGVVVDTHVKRITNLLGLTTSSNAEQIERDLMALLRESEWVNFSHRLIHHGRQICIARRPKCLECTLLPLCDRVGLPELKK